MEEKVQRTIVELLNTWDQGYETTLLEKLAAWVNREFISPYIIVRDGPYWKLERKSS